MTATNSIHLRSINQTLAQAVAGRDLLLLRQIDETLDQLEVENCVFSHFTHLIEKSVESIKASSACFDQQDKLLIMFQQTRDAVETLHEHSSAQCESARTDRALCDDDGIVEAYCTLLETLAALHHSLNDLCWAIGENAADHDRTLPGTFDNADDLFKAMGV